MVMGWVQELRVLNVEIDEAVAARASLPVLREFGPVAGQGFYDSAFNCYRCSCPKSGDAAEPNALHECCNDEQCICHKEA